MVDLPPNILWLPLSGNHIHWHSRENARILAYWLSKKEKREVLLTEVTQQFLTHHSCPELPRGTGGDYKWICNVLLTPFTGPTTFIVLLLIRTKPRPLDHCIKYQPRLGAVRKRKLPRMISMSLSRHYLNVFACRKAL